MKRCIAAACFVAVTVFGLATAEASSVVVEFTGSLTNIFDPDGVTGYTAPGDIGKSINGKLIIDPIGNHPTKTFSNKTQFTGDAVQDYPPLAPDGSATIYTGNGSGTSEFRIQFAAPVAHDIPSGTDFLPSVLTLDFFGPGAAPKLTSLAALPTDLAGIIAYLGGTGSRTGTLAGGPSVGHLLNLAFTIDSITISTTLTATPIPATLPLFGAGLAALGMVAWRRRSLRAV